MSRRVAGVNVNENQSNPFHPTSLIAVQRFAPLLGTPQGISVYRTACVSTSRFGDDCELGPDPGLGDLDDQPHSPVRTPCSALNTLGRRAVDPHQERRAVSGTAATLYGGSFGGARGGAARRRERRLDYL